MQDGNPVHGGKRIEAGYRIGIGFKISVEKDGQTGGCCFLGMAVFWCCFWLDGSMVLCGGRGDWLWVGRCYRLYGVWVV